MPRRRSVTPCSKAGRASTATASGIARTLLRAGDERPKPNGERLREFSDSGKVSLELALFSEKPIYTDLEILTLADSLTFLAGQLGATDPLVQKVLAGKSPRDRAVELINTTQVRDVAFRKHLYEGGAGAVTAARDPMIELARLVDPAARALRKVSEEQSEIKQQAHAAIARARNADAWQRRLSRRDLHAAARLRHGQRLRGRRQACARHHHDGRAFTSAPRK